MPELETYYPDGTDLISFRDGHILSSGPPPSTGLGPVVYTETDMAAWNASQEKYNALFTSGTMSLTRTITDKGVSINSIAERDQIRMDSEYAKGMAVIGRARENSGLDGTAYYAKAQEVLDSVRNVTSYSTQAGQDNLVGAWFTPNLCQVARIIGYTDPGFENFLRNVIHPMMDWTTGVNWFASFFDARTSIASYLEDEDLWNDAMFYGAFHLPLIFWHGTYDGTLVSTTNNNLWPAKLLSSVNITRTLIIWGNNANSYAQVDSTLVAEYDFGSPSNGTPFPNGACAERTRDLSHTNFSVAAVAHAFRTMEAVGVAVPQEWHDRFKDGVDDHATRCNSYINSGFTTIPLPLPRNGDGGLAYRAAWYPAERYLREDSPASLTAILAQSVVQNHSVVGLQHMTSEPVADRDV